MTPSVNRMTRHQRLRAVQTPRPRARNFEPRPQPECSLDCRQPRPSPHGGILGTPCGIADQANGSRTGSWSEDNAARGRKTSRHTRTLFSMKPRLDNHIVWCLCAILGGVVGGANATSPRTGQERKPIILSYGANGSSGDDESAVYRDHWSPDRRYIVRWHLEMPATSELTIIDARSRRALVHIDDMNDFVWVPHHPHRLVVAAGGPFGKGFLRMWEKGRRWRSLYRVHRPKAECFSLFGVTRDGQFIIYGHGPSGDLETYDPPHLRRWLRLPRSPVHVRPAKMPSARQRLYWVARYTGAKGADLRGAALPGADLAGADLESALLARANLVGANLSGAKLRWADLKGADLHNARLAGAELLGAHMEHADLTGADLQGATLVARPFPDADLTGARYDARTHWPAGFEPKRHGAIMANR
jgi:hypothetical protein